ncbi:UvrD-helicase domain-containing protein [Bosea sp. (in: a-proteobacteria)]|uniref:UvrD-helicase domain-containing protein n=1 Tax=Bosea sp. (in: a-proteobacteria) TaxID=1871050 RepID=UPI00273535E7|nr:UvrD-helicase domain-containing protein [Bosea sp. (in: a-proteobacteria)]MDP3411054.1 UvrD-helicase domain-containing protein [Bosea sp. (in: a-proteobacteria)]
MTEASTMQNRVDTTIASAGTGKTYRLVEEIVAEVGAALPPHRILATTFTKKAAAELVGRIRARLIEAGRPDLSAAMLSARIGTVNSVCGSLISEFAFELGRSPVAEVIAEDRQASVFSRAAGPVIEEFGPAISEIAERFGVQARSYSVHGRTVRGWQDDVRRAVDLARSNGIPPERLAHCAARSAAGLLGLLPAATGQAAEAFDAALASALEACTVELDRNKSGLKAGTLNKDVPTVDKAVRTLRGGDRISWPDWARLAKLGATKADEALFTHVVAAAAAHPRHPGLKSDLQRYIELIFDCAASCMTAYGEYKRARGLLDFVDQEMLALDIISNPANTERLRELIGAVFVDEFQDSSPIQIAIFTALSRIAGRNLWVGDPKQSIYGFRDADPALTSAASAAITAATGGTTGYLRRSYRARPQLAGFVNAAIAPNMLRVGMSEEEIMFDGCERTEDPDGQPGLSFWDMSGKNKVARTAILAGRIAGLLSDPAGWTVAMKGGGTREARGGDIAVLCRGNAQVGDLAFALSQHGIRVAVERSGLLFQPEIEFALAAFRWIADASDTLALAELARLATETDEWFAAVFDEDAKAGLIARVPFADALAAIRDRAHQLTPAEILDALLHAETVFATLLGWGNAEQRLQNLEALRGMVEAYQDEQHAERQAATLTGACEWVASRDNARQPQSRHPDAVNIMTYHAAKGLEWPIVILTELDAPAKGSPFGMIAQDEAAPDWSSPLAARVLRFWPWPYGEQQKDVGLDVSAPASPEGIAALAEERLERTRLLYVGLTRARDHLALANTGGSQTWLEELQANSGAPLISNAGTTINVGAEAFASRSSPDALDPAEATSDPVQEYMRPVSAPIAHPPLRIRPSDAILLEADVVVAATERLGDRIPLVGDPDLQLLGEAIHRFLAADDPNTGTTTRTSRAAATLARWTVPQVAPADLVEISDRLRSFVDTRFDGAAKLKEWPVHAEDGLQVVVSRLDLLVDLGDGYAIVDHKSFPGSVTLDQDRLREFAGQVSQYARAIERITGRKRIEYWIHQPIAAVMTRIELTE